jgi:Domain of unknown function (DUF4387)
MATLGDLAKLVRSKNAGPFCLTIDIMFDDAQAYRRARHLPDASAMTSGLKPHGVNSFSERDAPNASALPIC